MLLALFAGCSRPAVRPEDLRSPAIRTLKSYTETTVGPWQEAGVEVRRGETLILTPFYPKGFIFPVKGRVGNDGEPFEALDVDNGQVHTAATGGVLSLGIDNPVQPVKTAVFVAGDGNLEMILADLRSLSAQNRSASIRLTLGLLLKGVSEKRVLEGAVEEAQAAADEAIRCFEAVSPSGYAHTISRLYKAKASIRRLQGDRQGYEENTRLALLALIKASKHYGLLSQSRYAYLRGLNEEELYILVTKTRFFELAGQAYSQNWGFSFSHIAVARTLIGRYYCEVGNLKASLHYCESALYEARKSGNLNLISWVFCRGLGARHFAFGFLPEAKSSLLAAQRFATTPASRRCADFSLAVMNLHMNELGEAEQKLDRLALATAPNTLMDCFLQRRMGQLRMKKGDYSGALPLLERARKCFDSVPDGGQQLEATKAVSVDLDLCRSHLKRGSLSEAAGILSAIEAGPTADESNPIRIRLSLLQSDLFRQTGRDPAQPLLKAIDALEAIRPTAGSSEDYEYWEHRLEVYDKAIEALFEKNDVAAAFEVSEKARSRKFLDLLGSKTLNAKGDIGYLASRQAVGSSEALSEMEEDMRHAAAEAGIKLRSIYGPGTRYDRTYDRIRKGYAEAAAADPHFGVVYNRGTPAVADLQHQIPGDATILNYFIADDGLFAWVLTRERIHAVKQAVPRGRIEALVAGFRQSLLLAADSRGIRIAPSAGAAGANRELYDLLIKPLERFIQTERLVVIPFGVLNYVPFQALSDGSHYLVEKHTVTYLPCLSFVQFSRKPESAAAPAVLALGNPDLDDPGLDLPHAQAEVEIIKAVFPATSVMVRKDASEANTKSRIGAYDIVHFACHGEYRPEQPIQSCLLLSPGAGEDGRLAAEEIFDMQLKADLVVMSACRTAMGKIHRGDEIVGFTRAFLYAGAGSVLGSLWDISDDATAVFMQNFYRNIRAAGKAEALRSAQLAMIRSGDYSHPFYWAAFNLTGGF
jgi:CHAT domain-containing protein